MSDCAASFENASTMPGLVVWSSSIDEFDLLAEHAAGLVDRRQRELGAVLRPQPLLGCRTRHRHAHADLDGGALRPCALTIM